MDSKIIIIISDTSIKNNVVTLLSHVCSGYNIFSKTIYYIINIISTKTELFTIRCGINQVVQEIDVNCTIVITDTIHLARRIFDLLSYFYLLLSITIVQDLRGFFNKNSYNFIDFCDCPSSVKWTHCYGTLGH